MSRYLKIRYSGFPKIDVSEQQAIKMLHAIGADNKPCKKYSGRLYYHAYRNYYDAGGDDVIAWDDLVNKGLAECNKTYHLTPLGLNTLEILTGSSIYDNYHNYADCRSAVLTEFLKDSVHCGYGCWLPTPATQIAVRLHIPIALARESCRKLAEEGYIVKGHYGELSDYDCQVHCAHGYFVTEKARELGEWEELWKAECEYINRLNGEKA